MKQFLEEARNLIRINSISSRGNEEIANHVLQLMTARGMKTHLQQVTHSLENISKRQFNVIGILGDPLVDKKAVLKEHRIKLVDYNSTLKAHALVIAVPHDILKKNLSLNRLKKHLIFTGGKAVLIDVKGAWDLDAFKGTGILYWRL